MLLTCNSKSYKLVAESVLILPPDLLVLFLWLIQTSLFCLQIFSLEVLTYSQSMQQSTLTSPQTLKHTCIVLAVLAVLDTWVLPSTWSQKTTKRTSAKLKRNLEQKSNPFHLKLIRNFTQLNTSTTKCFRLLIIPMVENKPNLLLHGMELKVNIYASHLWSNIW